MNPEAKRQQVLQALIAHQQHIADTAKKEMDSAQQQSNDYGQNVDRYDSFRTKMMRARDMYARQYSNAIESIRHLQELLKQSPFETVDYGAIVITNKQRFCLSIGAGKFKVPFEGESQEFFFAISAQVPIYKVMQGKKVGDTFSFNGTSQTILEIY
ncbi:MAG: hypothetical protein Q4D03_02310 [Bacteroidales bacterium]|nr:hypothetical protein [Bacteroidales bacterium]